jgi:hypothetical protein
LAYQGRDISTNISEAASMRGRTDLSVEEQTQQEALTRTI